MPPRVNLQITASELRLISEDGADMGIFSRAAALDLVHSRREDLVEVDATDGCFPLPTGPGLGVTLNEAFVAEHPPGHAFFDLYAENWHRRQAGARSTTGTTTDGVTLSTDAEVHHG